jgi:3D (Asp-Asp-Asp) domain-containing protein
VRYYLFPLIAGLLASCATRQLPPYEKPLPRAEFQTVRTTAYTHTEGDHLEYGARNALGTRLQSGSVNSAAADWSRWPAGTRFRIVPDTQDAPAISTASVVHTAHGSANQPFFQKPQTELSPVYVVDDYGWAISGTNTIDLYKPSRAAMNQWGVRRVRIQVLEWGDPWRSYAILKSRGKHAHVKRMLRQIQDRY